MPNTKLDYFLKQGEVFGISKGDDIRKLPPKIELIPSMLNDDKEEVDLFDFELENLRVRIGAKKHLILYIMIDFRRHNLDQMFTLNGVDLRLVDLSTLLKSLSANSIAWEFKECLGKVIVINLGPGITEIVYSLEPKDEGIYCVQTYLG